MTKQTILLVALLLVSLYANAQEKVRQRNCRPQLYTMGVPDHFLANHRGFDFHGKQSLHRAGDVNPMIGDRRQLVVMAAYADQPFKGDDTQTLEQWNKILNGKNYRESPFHGSVSEYFLDQSYGQFNLIFDLYYATLPDSMMKYRSTYSDDENSKYLVQDAVEIIRDKVKDWAPYDWDGDGYVDQLLIIFSGKGQNDGGSYKTVWPHQWWLSKHSNCKPITVSSGGKEYYIDTYCCTPEKDGNGEYGSFGTLCHEYSHCFGLPDFYYGKTSFLYGWDLMDDGLYNDDGFRPCGYSAYERVFMGWLTPVELKADTNIVDMPALGDQPQAYFLVNDGAPQEYYLLENRQQTGWDSDLPGSGIVVFHVDYDESEFTNQYPNTSDKQRYTIIPANNKPTDLLGNNLKGWAYPYKNNNRLTNDSEPSSTLNNANTDGSFLMSKPITQMAIENGLASFQFTNSNTTSIDNIQWSTDNGQWYTIDGRRLSAKPTARGIYLNNGHKVIKH